MKYYYLIYIQYLGFRFHGWQKQPDLKTVHHVIDRTIKYVLKEEVFKTLGSSRTDARVSANESAFELFVKNPIDMEAFLEEFNTYLPADVKAVKIKEVDASFNIIQSPKLKQYQYLFAFGEKYHPFAASLMCLLAEDLDVELMKEGALLFEGKHNFKRYCAKPSPGTNFQREVLVSRIEENTEYQANFFPKKSYCYRVEGKGFMRYQIRLMMGELIELGRGNTTLEKIAASLENPDGKVVSYIASASGLILNKLSFE
ncbi:MAG: tRNA pseudouridine(38-40) synthase TruA [Cyclobacteriaceae bacterium]